MLRARGAGDKRSAPPGASTKCARKQWDKSGSDKSIAPPRGRHRQVSFLFLTPAWVFLFFDTGMLRLPASMGSLCSLANCACVLPSADMVTSENFQMSPSFSQGFRRRETIFPCMVSSEFFEWCTKFFAKKRTTAYWATTVHHCTSTRRTTHMELARFVKKNVQNISFELTKDRHLTECYFVTRYLV